MDTVQILKVLGEPMRYRIFEALLERKHCVRSLSKKLQVTESAISQHLKIMRENGLVYGEKYGYHTHYFPKQEAVDYLADMFCKMKEKSLTLDRDMTICNCEFKNTTAGDKP
ncbi:MAG: metalloregulator ArsR/SmtB family transcription factor [Treponema sp.]|nr:metalloregulator ArsR/SmtB family transcription factor [Treponema sp.]